MARAERIWTYVIMNLPGNSHGSVSIVALALSLVLSTVGSVPLGRTDRAGALAYEDVQYDDVFKYADIGAQRAVAELLDSAQWREGYYKSSFGDGFYTVSVLDSLRDNSLGDRVRVLSLGQRGDAAGGVEVDLLPAGPHPLYDYAIYSGNWIECATSSAQPLLATLEFGGSGSSADRVVGDVFHNGNISVSGEARIHGLAEAGGQYHGTPPEGGAINQSLCIRPPDLEAMAYKASADVIVNSESHPDKMGRLASSDPSHIFLAKAKSSKAIPASLAFDNANYFLGDTWEGKGEFSVSAKGNDKTYFVDGNLWIGLSGEGTRLVHSPDAGTHITVVVKGNIYFCSGLEYDNPTVDGIAFVAMTDGESFVDQDADNQYDEGEPLLRDDGDDDFEGPREGSGNIYFGHPAGNALGQVQAFLYADNAIKYLGGGAPQPIEVTGTLSAGQEFDLQGDLTASHVPLRVHYDSRLRDGLLTLPDLPTQSGQTPGLVVVSWREF